MDIKEAVRIATSGKGNAEEPCRFIIKEARKIAGHVSVEKMESFGIRSGAVFDREKSVIKISPMRFLFDLEKHFRDTAIPYETLLWWSIEHEKGHYELKQQGLEPLFPKDETYMILYGRIEDYLISKFLRGGRYGQVDRAVVKAEASSAEPRTLNDLAIVGLSVALGYVDLRQLKLHHEFHKAVHMIASEMKGIKKLSDAPGVTRQLMLKLKNMQILDKITRYLEDKVS